MVMMPRQQPHREKPQAPQAPKVPAVSVVVSEVGRITIQEQGKWYDAYAGVWRTREDL